MEQREDRAGTTGRARGLSRRELLSRGAYGLGGILAAGTVIATPAGAAAATRRVARRPRLDAAARLSGAAQPRGVCAGRGGVMVVGETFTGQAVSWRSRNGRHWDERRLPAPAPGQPDVWGVAAHGGRFVAVGSLLQRQVTPVRPDRSAAGEVAALTVTSARRLPAVWWTRDGTTWVGETVASGGAAHAQLTAVSCNSRLLVAVGSTLDADGVQGAGGLVLVSEDGHRWVPGQIAKGDGALPEGSLTGVVAAGGRWFATSTDMSGGAVWTSPDGRRWALVDSSRAQFDGVTLQGLAVRGRHLVVAATGLTDHRTSYHASADGGRTWRTGPVRTRALDHVDITVTDLAVVDGDVVVVGTHGGVPMIERGVTDVGD